MCQTRPGPRCASHTRTELRKTERELTIAREVRDQAIAHRAAATGQHPDVIVALPPASFRKVFADYQDALTAHAEAQAAHDATRTGQTALKAALADAKARGDYTTAQRLTHRLNQGAARHAFDLTLANIAADQHARLTNPPPAAAAAITKAAHDMQMAHHRYTALAATPAAADQAYARIGDTWITEDTHEALTTYHRARQHLQITRSLAGANLPTNYRLKTVQAGYPNPISHHTDGSTNAYLHHPEQEGLDHGYLSPLTHQPAPELATGYRLIDTITGDTVYPTPGDPYGDIPATLIVLPDHATADLQPAAG